VISLRFPRRSRRAAHAATVSVVCNAETECAISSNPFGRALSPSRPKLGRALGSSTSNPEVAVGSRGSYAEIRCDLRPQNIDPNPTGQKVTLYRPIRDRSERSRKRSRMSRLAGIKPLNRSNLCTRDLTYLCLGTYTARGHHDWPVKWGSRPLAKFIVTPNAINGRQRRFYDVIGNRPISGPPTILDPVGCGMPITN
jgi:hypothetical protein